MGVVSLVRVVNGVLPKGARIRMWSTGRTHIATEVGAFTPKAQFRDALEAGEVGYVVAGIKDVHGAPVGDTITLESRLCDAPLPGFRQIKPRVFAGLFPDPGGRFRGTAHRPRQAAPE